jgi:pimeloyl-ACP methyl ester carboxylesterase
MHDPAPAAPYRSCYARCAGREIHYLDWGGDAPDAAGRPVVVAWHGLARNGRDMDALAQYLSCTATPRWRVIAPDTLGRGLSQWSPRPDDEYCLAFYAELAAALVDQLGLARFAWVGTSMGGAIGTVCAAGPLAGRITRLLLNDNGPSLARPALERIRAYAGRPQAFATLTELEAYFRQVYAPFGAMSDAQWRHLTETSVRRLPDGRVTPHYDPAMVRQFETRPDDYELWDAYERLAIPVLCLRGADSDLLLRDTTERMRRCGPRAVVVEIEGCGHAPPLHVPAQWALVERFLRGDALPAADATTAAAGMQTATAH